MDSSYQAYVKPWVGAGGPSFYMDVPVDSVREVVVDGVTIKAYHSVGVEGAWILYGWNYFLTGNFLYLLAYDDLLCDIIYCPYYLRCYEDQDISFHRREFPPENHGFVTELERIFSYFSACISFSHGPTCNAVSYLPVSWV